MTALHPADERFEDAPCPLCGERTAHEVVRGTDRLRPGDLAAYVVARCDACGLAYTKPRPTPAAMGGFYPPSYSGAGGGGLIDRIEAVVPRSPAARGRERGSPSCGPGEAACSTSAAAAATCCWRCAATAGTPTASSRRREGVARRAHARARRDARADSRSLTAGPSAYDVVVFPECSSTCTTRSEALRGSRMLAARRAASSPCCSCRCCDSPQARLVRPRWLALDLPRHLTHFESDATFPRFASRARGCEIARREDYSRRHNASQLVGSLCPGAAEAPRLSLRRRRRRRHGDARRPQKHRDRLAPASPKRAAYVAAVGRRQAREPAPKRGAAT